MQGTSPSRSALAIQPSATLARASAGSVDAGAFAQPADPGVARATRLAGFCSVTPSRSDMKLVAPFVSEREATCAQGQPLEWLGYEVRDDLHWFGAGDQTRTAVRTGTATRRIAFRDVIETKSIYANSPHFSWIHSSKLVTPSSRMPGWLNLNSAVPNPKSSTF